MNLDRVMELAITVIMIALIIGILFAACMPFYMFAKANKELETAIANGYEIIPTVDNDKPLADKMIANLQTLAKTTNE